jgi:hypothetical protein
MYRLTLRPGQIAYFTYPPGRSGARLTDSTKPPLQNKNPYDRIVQHAIDSQGDKVVHRGSGEFAINESHEGPASTHPVAQARAPRDAPQEELQRNWAWSVAEEMMVDAKEDKTSQILDEVGRMEVLDAGARVREVKEQLDHLEDEGGPVLNLRDSH